MLSRGVRTCSDFASSRLKRLDHSLGTTFLMLYLIGKRSGISCRPWSIIKVIALWSESRDRSGLTAHCLNVSSLVASGFAKDKSITDGLSPACLAKCVISPLLLRREKFSSASQSAIVVDSWS